MKVQIELKGLDRMLSKFKNAPEIVRQTKRSVLTRGALIALRKAKTTTPIDKGILRSSIDMRGLRDDEVRVGTNLDYARYQEYGTGVYAGRGMIRPRNARRLAWKKNGQWIFACAVKGVKGRHFMKAGFEEVKGRMGELQAEFKKITKALSF